MSREFSAGSDARSESVATDPRFELLRDRRPLATMLLMLWIASIDIAIILFAFKVVSVTYRIYAFPPRVTMLSSWAAIGFIASGIALNIYSVKALESRQLSLELTARSMGRALVITAIAIFLLSVSENVSRTVFVIGFAASTTLLLMHRIFANSYYLRLVRAFGPDTLVIGDAASPPDLPFANFVVAAEPCPDPLRPESLDAFGRLTRRYDRVVVACSVDRRADWAFALRCGQVRGEVVVTEIDDLRPLGVAHDQGVTRLVVSTPGLATHERTIKRLFDIIVAGAALVLLSPLLLATAIAIKLSDGGPVIFRQQRVGRSNLFFDVLKFRTMRVDRSDATASMLTTRGDARVTRVGRWLRTTSIDELPQLLNVLRGEMSIVGPRPHALGAKAGSDLYWEVDPTYWHRHIVKPGLTGLAQVRGFRGPTDAPQDLSLRLSADLEYTRRWTIWRDMIIMVRTLLVLRHGNAF